MTADFPVSIGERLHGANNLRIVNIITNGVNDSVICEEVLGSGNNGIGYSTNLRLLRCMAKYIVQCFAVSLINGK